MINHKEYYLQAMGIDRWISRPKINLKPLQPQRLCIRGNPQAPLMIVLESQTQALALSGKAASLLNQMLEAIGLAEEKTFQGEILSEQRPSDPNSSEMRLWREELQQEIERLQPKFILILGASAMQCILTDSFEEIRGTIHNLKGRPLIASHHPLALLEQPIHKKQAFLDWSLLKEQLQALNLSLSK